MGAQLYALSEPHILRVLAGEPQHFHRTPAKTAGGLG